jgi:hypothetical protein
MGQALHGGRESVKGHQETSLGDDVTRARESVH